MPKHCGQFAALTLLSLGALAVQAGTEPTTSPSFHPLGNASKPKASIEAEQVRAELPKVLFEMQAHYHPDGRVELRCEQVHERAGDDGADSRQEKQK